MLISVMDVKTVQVAGFIHVSKPHQNARLFRHQSAVSAEGAVPGGQIHRAGGPGIQLAGGVVPGVDDVDRVVEQLRHFRTVRRAIRANCVHQCPPVYECAWMRLRSEWRNSTAEHGVPVLLLTFTA